MDKTIMKKLSKTLVLIPALAFLVSISVIAQPHPQPNQGPQRPPIPNEEQIGEMIENLSKVLDLTAEQKKQLSDLHKRHFAEVKKNMDQQESEMKKHHEKMEAMRKDFEKKIESIMTKEQVEKFEALRKTQKPFGATEKPKGKN